MSEEEIKKLIFDYLVDNLRLNTRREYDGSKEAFIELMDESTGKWKEIGWSITIERSDYDG